MCLIVSVVLTVLSVNFYLNGFMIQAVMTGVLALALLIVMIKNVQCRKSGCSMKFKTEEDKR